MMKRGSDTFSVHAPRSTDACWQIDNDRLPPPQEDGEWESALALALHDLAEAHSAAELAIFTWSGDSVDFGHQGFSVWLTLSGSPPLVKAARDKLVEMIEPRYRRADVVNPHASWQARIRICDGQVWVPEDAASWATLANAPADASVIESEIKEAPTQPKWFDDVEDELPTDEAKPPRKARRAGLRQSFQYNVRLSYYQRKLEELGGMPEGSIRFLTPDGELANPSMHVGTLRRRWEDAES